MTFNPLEEKGIPLDVQVRNWSELNTEPYDKSDALELELAAPQAATVATRLCVTNATVLARLAQRPTPARPRTR